MKVIWHDGRIRINELFIVSHEEAKLAFDCLPRNMPRIMVENDNATILRDDGPDNNFKKEYCESIKTQNNMITFLKPFVCVCGIIAGAYLYKNIQNKIKNKYPNHLMIEDIGSGINFNKRWLRKIIKLAIAGRI